MKRVLPGLLIGLALLAAGRHLRSPGDSLAVEGNAAYAHGDFVTAADRYAQASSSASDPALVAHNYAAALYRQGRFDEADHQYEQSAVGGLRTARAEFDRGNCALAQAAHGDSTDRALVLKAAEHYRTALQQEGALPQSGQLFADARHNLELAKRLLADEHESTQAQPGQEKQEEECPRCKAEREAAMGWNTRANDPFDPQNSANPRESSSAQAAAERERKELAERLPQHCPT
jgi:tetratricopeptide (TPR) repeat protein